MRESKGITYACGLSAVVVGLSLYSYDVRELLIGLALFTIACLAMGSAALGLFLVCYTTGKTARWVGLASRSMLAHSRRAILPNTRP